jgi:hypothetical protein
MHPFCTWLHPRFVGIASGIRVPCDPAEWASVMSTEYLDQLARQLKIDKTPACRRAINRILEDLKKRCESGEFATPMDAEAAFRKFVEDERACQKAKAESV